VPLLILQVAACSHTINVAQVRVKGTPPDINELAIHVDEKRNNESGEATALKNGLIREFNKRGFRLGENGQELRVAITRMDMGSNVASAMLGGLAGNDTIEVEVELLDGGGNVLMSFLVSTKILDKRYMNVHKLLKDKVPPKIAEQIQGWK